MSKDYVEMKEMFPADALSFEGVLEKLKVLETRINALQEPAK